MSDTGNRRLQTLIELYESGALTAEEFAREKSALDASDDATDEEEQDVDDYPEEPTLAGGIANWILDHLWTVIGSLIVLLIVGRCSVQLFQGDSEGSERSLTEMGYASEIACEDLVRERLKAPATAKFANVEHSWLKGESFSVSGSVDSENGFGALVRSDFTCELTLNGDYWRGSVLVN